MSPRDVALRLNRFPELSKQLHDWFDQNKESYGPSLADASQKIGISYSALRHYYAGHSFPTGAQLTALRQHTRLPVLESGERPTGPSRHKKARGPIDLPEPIADESPHIPDRNRDLLVAMRVWMGQNPRYRNRSVLAEALGVDESTVQRWLSGSMYPGPDQQQRLTSLTGIGFGSKGPMPRSAETPPASPPSAVWTLQAKNAHRALLEVVKALDPFIQGPPEARRILQQTCPRDDAGFVTSVLNALYDDESVFQTWKFFNVESREQEKED